MLILAIDTTTRAGSICVMRDGEVLSASTGDAQRTHAERLPGDLIAALGAHGLQLGDVDAFVVAAGPGSFTGLRIGIATIQGLAFALGRPVVGVSVLDAVAVAARKEAGEHHPQLIGAFLDAQRNEVFACLYRGTAFDKVEKPADESASPDGGGLLPHLEVVDAAVSQPPVTVLKRWAALSDGAPIHLAGDGVDRYPEVIREHLGSAARVLQLTQPLAATVAEIGCDRLRLGHGTSPHAIKPIYVRRPDAELARDRKASS